MSKSQSVLANWLNGRKEQWKQLAVLVGKRQDQRDDDPDEVREIVTGFKALAMLTASSPEEALPTVSHPMEVRRSTSCSAVAESSSTSITLFTIFPFISKGRNQKRCFPVFPKVR